MPTSNENVAKNLEAIRNAVVQHNGNCPGTLVAIEMHPVEVERLDFDEFMGIEIKENPEVGTGSFNLVCDLDQQAPDLPGTGDTADKRESVTA